MIARKKPLDVEVHQWLKNGDHPDDHVGWKVQDPISGEEFERLEGEVVRFFRHPDYASFARHDKCGHHWHDHGWIDTLEGGHTVCPGDYIATGVQGEHWPIKPDIFEATYDVIKA